MIHIGLFEGIGGFSLAARWAGWKTYATCEIAEFPQKVLKYHFPYAYHHGDIKTLTYETIDAELSARFGNKWRTDDIIITGGFPCQPYSSAGKRLGKEDDRHLWPEMLRIIREVRPTWIVGENVLGLVNWSGGLVFEEVQADLEAEGYEVQPYVLPAASVGAPHRRDRVWFVAHANNSGSEKSIVQHSDLFAGSVGNNEQTIVDADNKRRSAEPGQVQSENAEVPKRHNNAEPGNAGDGVVADTNNKRHEKCNASTKPIKQELRDRICFEDAPNTKQPRRERREWFAESQRLKSEAWDNWPTAEPTIRGRDDGLSYRLDDITFSKWRNESIKAYGNAIVPQVALQIFKAINIFSSNQNSKL